MTNNKKQCKPVTLQEIERRLNKQNQNTKVNNNTILEVQNYHETLIEAMMRPDLGRAITFPLSMVSGPSIPVHNRDTLFITTNFNGCAWVEVNFGQYLDQGVIANGINYQAANGVINPACGSLPRGNVFYYTNNNTTTSDLDGVNPLLPTLDNNPLSGLGTGGVASSPVVEGIGIYTAIRCGPQTATWDYTGRIDISQGIATMAINYTYVADTGASANQTANFPTGGFSANPLTYNISQLDTNLTPPAVNANLSLTNYNGFIPDYNFSTLKAVEDCPISVTVPSTENLTGVFIPHDYGVMNYRGSQVGFSGIQQRLFFLITSGPSLSQVGKMTVQMNWDAKPTSRFADQAINTMGLYAKTEDLTKAMNWLLTNNRVVFSNPNNMWGVSRLFKNVQ